MKKITLLALTVCIATMAFAQQLSLSGKITGIPNGTKFYLKDPEADLFLDSAVIMDNVFKMGVKLDEAPKGLFLSAAVDKNYYWCYLFVANEAVQISGDKKDFPFYLTISGSRSQDAYNILNDKTRPLMTLRSSLTENIGPLLSDESDSGKAKLNGIGKRLNHIDSLTDSIKITFIRGNLNSYAALNELYWLKEKFPKDTLRQMYNGLTDGFKRSVYGERIANYLKVGAPVKTGDRYHDFEASDQFGTRHKISELRGKFVLLDFTETYCGPCILSTEELKQVAGSYADSLYIVSFWADKSRATWQAGLSRDKQPWLCLWDGKGSYGETLLKYGIRGYPSFVLIDPAGKIVSEWTGYGKGDITKAIADKIKM